MPGGAFPSLPIGTPSARLIGILNAGQQPGLTDINQWPARAHSPAAPLVFYGGLARKPG